MRQPNQKKLLNGLESGGLDLLVWESEAPTHKDDMDNKSARRECDLGTRVLEVLHNKQPHMFVHHL
jgi:hypothetical protein